MAETLGTRDVLEQVDARLDNVERDIRELRQEIGGLRSDIKAEVGGLRTEMKTEIGGLRTEMKTEIGGLRAEMNSRFDRVYQEMSGLRAEIRWMYGLLVAVLLGVAGLWFK